MRAKDVAPKGKSESKRAPRKTPKVEPRRKRGGQSHVPTDELRLHVQRLRLVGTTQNMVARILGIDEDTLVKHYTYELELSKSDLMANIGATLYQKALGGDVAACIFILKTQAGWRETERKELTGPDGAPLPAMTLPPLVLVEYVDGDPADQEPAA